MFKHENEEHILSGDHKLIVATGDLSQCCTLEIIIFHVSEILQPRSIMTGFAVQQKSNQFVGIQ